MKKVLLINNYDMANTRQAYLDGRSPSFHQFGTSELIDSGEYTVDYLLVSPKKINSRILKMLSLFPIWLKAYHKAKKYDYVYGAADFTVDFMGMMKKIGLFKPQLLTILHHPPFGFRLKIAKYNRIIFLSSFAYNDMSSNFPQLHSKMSFLQWGPDLNFYQKFSPTPNFEKKHNQIVFISNGKTHRDHETFLSAAEKSKNKIIIVCDEKSIPHNYKQETCNYTEIFYQNKPDDIKMIQLLEHCSVLVIPTYSGRKRLGPIGLTSFLDAVAMGIPVITADNTVLTDIVEKEKLGFVYKAGNIDDLCEKMNRFTENPELISVYGKNAADFGLKNDINRFADQLKVIIEKM